MTYSELQNLVSSVEEGKKLVFDLSYLNDEVSTKIDEFINLSEKLHLFNSKIKEINERITNFSGEIRLSGSNAYFETNIFLINNQPLDYIITIEPNGKWLKKVSSTIKKTLDLLPVDFEETIFIHSSLKVPETTISFDESKIYEVAVNKGNSIATHIKSKILKILNLPDTLFFIEKTEEGLYKIFKDLEFEVDLAGLLKLDAKKININNKDSFSLDCNIELPFLNNALDCSVAVTAESYHTRVKIEEEVRLPIQEVLKGLNIANIELDFHGSFINPNEYVYGLSGNFAIGEPVTVNTEHDFSYSTLKPNEFNLKFNPTSSTYIPVFFQSFIDEISMSKGITLITGTNPNLPRFIDPIKLYSTYIYYCAPNQQNLLLNGVKAKKGIAISSGINILGLDAYCEYSAIENRTTGNIILEPINIANLVKIEGNAQGTPATYTGPKIEKGGVQLFFDSQGPIYFSTDLRVNLFDLFDINAGARVQEKGLQFYTDIDLGIAIVQCNCLLKSINDFRFKSEFEATIVGVNADLGSLGKLSINLDIFVKVDFSIKIKSSDGFATVELGFAFNGSSQKINLSINVKDLKNIERYLKEEVIEFVEDLLLSPLEWLKSILDEAIKVAENIVEEAKVIAERLEKEFEKTIEKSAKLLKKAGYETEKAARVLLSGFSSTTKDVAKVLVDAKYPVKEISKALNNLTENTVREIFEVMKNIGAPIEEIAKGLKSVGRELENVLKELNLSEKEAAALLKGLGKTVQEQGRILKDVLGFGKQATTDALNAVGNAAGAVARAVGGLFGGGGGGGPRCVLSSASVNYKKLPDDCYELQLLRDFRDSFMSKLTNGKQLIEEYYSLSDAIVGKVQEYKIEDEFYAKVYNELIIPSVNLIEKNKKNEAFHYYRQFVLNAYNDLHNN